MTRRIPLCSIGFVRWVGVASTVIAAPLTAAATAGAATRASMSLGVVSARAHPTSSTPAIVVAVGVLAVVLVLLAGLWLFARWAAWEPRWWRHMSHVGAEASFHLETTWSEFRDWLRLGG